MAFKNKKMSEGTQPQKDRDQELGALTKQERKAKGKWVSFKKALRADRSIDPDCADEKYREEEAKYEETMKLINAQRGH
jgi:hypothetical protein